MSVEVHASAVVHAEAVIGKGTRIGPFAIIGPKAIIGENCDIQEHAIIRGNTTLGNDVKVFPSAAIGLEPQHLGYKGEDTTVVIGNRTILREFSTVHRGSTSGSGITTIGDDCYIMAYSHVAHDCTVGKKVILANGVQLAGHVQVGDYATIGGLTGVVQFCRVGAYCYVGGASMLRKDLPPFLVGKGNDFHVQGINQVGLSRNAFSPEVISELKQAYKILYLQKLTVPQALEKISVELSDSESIRKLTDFIKSSKLGFER